MSFPLGDLLIEATDTHLISISRLPKENDIVSKPNPITEKTCEQLKEYFEGHRQNFELPIDFPLATAFQKEVWLHLCETEYGKVYSYKDLAISCGDVKKIRAVGRANGANPIPIVVPCHRIIGSDGSLVGYSGGLDMKRFLLKLEKAPIQLSIF